MIIQSKPTVNCGREINTTQDIRVVQNKRNTNKRCHSCDRKGYLLNGYCSQQCEEGSNPTQRA